MGARKHITGRVTAVQEQRFRLITEDGRGFLLTAANGVELSELQRLQSSRVRVRVAYTGESNLISGVAHSLRPLSEHQ